MSNDPSPIILAFSGGLDTSFCVPWLKETYGRDVVTVTVDTGGIQAQDVNKNMENKQEGKYLSEYSFEVWDKGHES